MQQLTMIRVAVLILALQAGHAEAAMVAQSEAWAEPPAAYGPPAPAKPKPAPTVAQPNRCQTEIPREADVIIVCAERPTGYRIDPDVLKAGRQARSRTPRRPEIFSDTTCKTVGPAGCTGPPAIDLLMAATVAATMVSKALKGENVGKMFVTRPEHSEYDLYRIAKREREEAEMKAVAIAGATVSDAASITQERASTPPSEHLEPDAPLVPGKPTTLPSMR